MDNFDLKKYLAEGKLLNESTPGYDTRKQGEVLPTLESVKAAYEAKMNIKEGKLTEFKLFGLIESEDGRFNGKAPKVLIQASNLKAAEKLADEYTNGQYSKYKNGYFILRPETIKIYK